MPGPNLNHVVNSEVGADKRLLGHTDSNTDESIQNLVNQISRHGYVVIPNAFSDAEVAEAKLELARLSQEKKSQAQKQAAASSSSRAAAAASKGLPAGSGGRNTFEGLKTERIYALANKSRVFDKFALHPDVLALNDHFLESGYLLNSFQSITIRPGEKPQTLHHDDGYIRVSRPHPPFGAAIMIALDPYTSTNGATVIVPESHTWGNDRFPDAASEAIPVIMPAGSMFYFLSTLWHGGGENTSGQDRAALTVQYCSSWVRQLENQMLAVEWDKLDEMPPRLVDMLGYKVGAPFIGHVDGRSPRVAVERMMREKWGRNVAEKGSSRL